MKDFFYQQRRSARSQGRPVPTQSAGVYPDTYGPLRNSDTWTVSQDAIAASGVMGGFSMPLTLVQRACLDLYPPRANLERIAAHRELVAKAAAANVAAAAANVEAADAAAVKAIDDAGRDKQIQDLKAKLARKRRRVPDPEQVSDDDDEEKNEKPSTEDRFAALHKQFRNGGA